MSPPPAGHGQVHHTAPGRMHPQDANVGATAEGSIRRNPRPRLVSRLRARVIRRYERNPTLSSVAQETGASGAQQNSRPFRIVLIKPSHYDDDGYVIRWRWSTMPSNSLASVYGLIKDAIERKVLGDL